MRTRSATLGGKIDGEQSLGLTSFQKLQELPLIYMHLYMFGVCSCDNPHVQVCGAGLSISLWGL